MSPEETAQGAGDHPPQRPFANPADRRPARHEPDHLRQAADGRAARRAGRHHRRRDRSGPPGRRGQGSAARQNARSGGGPGGRRSQPAAADRLEPALQRGQIHPQGRTRAHPADAGPSRTSRSRSATPARGFRREFLPHVFERFRQADASTTRRHTGLGLGLAIVRHLVELHGGSVIVFSAGEGKGASFTVSLPSPEPAEMADGGSLPAAALPEPDEVGPAPSGRREGAGRRRRTGKPRAVPPAAGRLRRVGRDGRFSRRGAGGACAAAGRVCCCPTSACRRRTATA